ncbi:hypothetical protein SCHPADRAFT_576764 [Schizopora paradoxa]|uniref:Uncharacterized protein n=1 Tax=Schizopora paradoxa TaxID=27342 RepID=A0A0H2RIC5_9AGAM|nr:hypothetical protein SCHPADRAFT_576764 [Schizopora paradoxa]
MPTTEPCQCQLQARRELEYAPEPPASMAGNLAYGYLVEHPMVETVVRKCLGERQLSFPGKLGVFKAACRYIVSRHLWPEGLALRLRADIHESEYVKETLRGYLILVATQESRVMARLEAYLETDAKPQWCKIL